MDPQARKSSIERAANEGGIRDVYADLKEYLADHRTVTDFHFGYKLLHKFQPDLRKHVFAEQVRLALLASYTTSFLTPLLETDLMLEDLDCEIYTGRYNQIHQEVVDHESALYKFRPDITILDLSIEDIFQDRIANFPILKPSERNEFKREILDTYQLLAQCFHDRMPVSGRSFLLVQNQSYPFQAYDPLAGFDDSLQAFVRDINRDLAQLCRKFPNTYLLDGAALMEQHGIRGWRDPRLYYTVHIPVAQQNWLHLSNAYVGYIKAALNLTLKCIVLDLDNTLWGGILGEEGMDNIQLGNTYPGAAFRKFQQYLLSLHANGYILAIASKNNSDDVREVLQRHRSMVLKQEHFAGIKVNWREKAENIKELSREIGISVDHMLFVDDNPVEIGKVKSALPTITCVQLDSPPLDFLPQFERLRCFGKLTLTEEDRLRGEWYFRDRQRRELKQDTISLEDFHVNLRQRLTIHANSRRHLPRIVQLTERTNQFNMATIRLTERQAEELLKRPEYLLVTAELADRFGDNGIIAYAQIKKADRIWQLENFLMSCRVLGRMAEETLLDQLIEMAKEQGAEFLEARFVMTKKNAPFADFYPRNGFAALDSVSDNGNGKRYVLNLASHNPHARMIEVVKNNE